MKSVFVQHFHLVLSYQCTYPPLIRCDSKKINTRIKWKVKSHVLEFEFLTVALSLSFKLRESESTPELEPAGDLICVLLDLN